VSAGYELTLLRRARDLADLSDLAEDAVRLLGGARAAGLDPEALRGLVGAAYALGANPIRIYTAGRYRRGGYPTEREFLEDLAATEDDTADRLRAVGRLQSDTVAALGVALEALEDAKAMPVREPCKGCHDDRDAAIADAEARIVICRKVAAITDPLAVRLAHALKRLRAVPADLGETYESLYNLVRSGGRMPRRGRWISGEAPRAARQGNGRQ